MGGESDEITVVPSLAVCLYYRPFGCSPAPEATMCAIDRAGCVESLIM